MGSQGVGGPVGDPRSRRRLHFDPRLDEAQAARSAQLAGYEIDHLDHDSSGVLEHLEGQMLIHILW